MKLLCYYKPRPLKSLLSPKLKKQINDISHVVYQYNCPEDGCNATYIGYTTCALSKRVYQHKYNGAIRLHLHEQHNEGAKNLTTENFTIIFNERQKSNLQIAEAILIKKHKPIINRRLEGLTRKLFIF